MGREGWALGPEFADDAEVKVLRIINRLLDRFLTAELPGWISADEQTARERTSRIEEAVNHTFYDKWREHNDR